MVASGNRDAVLINYAARTPERPRYYANDHSRDTVVIEQHAMPVIDARPYGLDLDGAGFGLVSHRSAAGDLRDKANGSAYAAEIETLLRDLTAADAVVVTGMPIPRFSERSGRAGSSDNSHPARFAHVDLSDTTGVTFSNRTNPDGRPYARAAHYNVWRVLSDSPQDCRSPCATRAA